MASAASVTPDPETEAIFALISEGKADAAQVRNDALLTREPGHALGWYLRGVIFRNSGDSNAALASLNKALKLKPDFRKACDDLARLLFDTGKVDMAIRTYEHLLRIELAGAVTQPPLSLSPTAHAAMFARVEESDKAYRAGNAEKAAEALRKALVIAPNLPDLLVNLGLMLITLRRYKEAEKTLLQALLLKPQNGDALNLLGNCYKDSGHYPKAIAAYRMALKASPTLRHASVNLGKTYFEMQLYSDSIGAYRQTLAIDPDYLEAISELLYLSHLLCRWQEVGALRQRMLDAIAKGEQAAEPFIASVYVPALAQRANAERWSKRLYPAAVPYDAKVPLPKEARGDGKIRLGYLSSDYHRHATAVLISELFEHHDREKFSVYAYSHGNEDNGPERKRIEKAVDCFRDIYRLDDREADLLIRSDEIDILIDLKGFTQGHRLSLVATRPAPIQMHYLGFPGTTGSSLMDYFVADPVSAPLALEAAFTEKFIRLPHSYQINDRSRPLPKTGPSRADYKLPEDAFVFCDFNNPYKITPDIFAVWMRLLNQVEGSVLWLMETHKEATENMREVAASCGIAPERIVTAGPVPLHEHLARYRHVDLFLDTTPVCGHTTASDALWCAVPMVTIAGESFMARVSASLFHAVGLPELVVENLVDYETLALALARDPARRLAIRRHLEEGREHFALFDSLATTRALEAGYRHAEALHRNGKPPAHFSV